MPSLSPDRDHIHSPEPKYGKVEPRTKQHPRLYGHAVDENLVVKRYARWEREKEQEEIQRLQSQSQQSIEDSHRRYSELQQTSNDIQVPPPIINLSEYAYPPLNLDWNQSHKKTQLEQSQITSDTIQRFKYTIDDLTYRKQREASGADDTEDNYYYYLDWERLEEDDKENQQNYNQQSQYKSSKSSQFKNLSPNELRRKTTQELDKDRKQQELKEQRDLEERQLRQRDEKLLAGDVGSERMKEKFKLEREEQMQRREEEDEKLLETQDLDLNEFQVLSFGRSKQFLEAPLPLVCQTCFEECYLVCESGLHRFCCPEHRVCDCNEKLVDDDKIDDQLYEQDPIQAELEASVKPLKLQQQDSDSNYNNSIAVHQKFTEWLQERDRVRQKMNDPHRKKRKRRDTVKIDIQKGGKKGQGCKGKAGNVSESISTQAKTIDVSDSKSGAGSTVTAVNYDVNKRQAPQNMNLKKTTVNFNQDVQVRQFDIKAIHKDDETNTTSSQKLSDNHDSESDPNLVCLPVDSQYRQSSQQSIFKKQFQSIRPGLHVPYCPLCFQAPCQKYFCEDCRSVSYCSQLHKDQHRELHQLGFENLAQKYGIEYEKVTVNKVQKSLSSQYHYGLDYEYRILHDKLLKKKQKEQMKQHRRKTRQIEMQRKRWETEEKRQSEQCVNFGEEEEILGEDDSTISKASSSIQWIFEAHQYEEDELNDIPDGSKQKQEQEIVSSSSESASSSSSSSESQTSMSTAVSSSINVANSNVIVNSSKNLKNCQDKHSQYINGHPCLNMPTCSQFRYTWQAKKEHYLLKQYMDFPILDVDHEDSVDNGTKNSQIGGKDTEDYHSDNESDDSDDYYVNINDDYNSTISPKSESLAVSDPTVSILQQKKPKKSDTIKRDNRYFSS